MNFFFQRKLKQQLHRTALPVRAEFLSNLRASLIVTAEEDQKRSFTRTMKQYKGLFSLSLVPIGIAIALVVIQVSDRSTTNTNGILDIPAVLAESIANTFQLNNTTDFTHQQFLLEEYMADEPAQPVTIDMWRYQENVRMNIHFTEPNTGEQIGLSTIISDYDDESCLYANLPDFGDDSSVVGGQPVSRKPECDDIFEVQMAPLTIGALSVSDVHIVEATTEEQVDNPGVTSYIVWSTEIEPGEMTVSFSRHNSGYSDAGGYAELVSQDGEVYTYRAMITQMEERPDEIHIGSSVTQLVQFNQGGMSATNVFSPIYELHLDTGEVREVSVDELAALQNQYKKALRAEAVETQSAEEIYDDFFGPAIALKDELASLTPISQADELYKGQQVVRVRYALPDSSSAQEALLDISEVEFVIDINGKYILAYQSMNASGDIVDAMRVEVSEVITGVDPQQFFSIDQWKKEIAVE